MDRNLKWHWIYWASAIFLVLLLQDVWEGVAHTEAVPYSEFEQALAEGRIKNVIVQDRTVTGELKSPQGRKTALMAVRVEPELAAHLDKYKVTYSRVVQSNLLSGLLSWLLPSLLVLGIWYFVIRKMADTRGPGGFLTIGKSRAKVYVVHDTGVTFADVAGVDEAKDELKEVVDFLKHPADFGRLGAHIPRGVLLVGPPGTGKTLLAKAVAGEAGTAFFSISGSEFVELFVGVGAARVRDLFEQARQKAPAIIFIDELDALGRARGAYPELGGHDEKEQTLNQLLAEMDGFDTSPGIVILAATNRPEILDPALLRAGRFDRQVMVDRPDRKGRVDILKVHIRKVKTDPALSLDEVAGFTAGFSGADLASLVNEAAIAATRRKADAVGADDFTVAFERIVAGLEKRNRVLDPAERERAAYHEMGHALVALSRPGDPVHKVSIIPRGGGALGYTIQRPTEDRYLMRRDELEHKVAVLLGGRAAEKLVFGEVSTGAADDLAKATQIAHEMVTRFGMDEGLGCASYESSRSAVREVTGGSIALRYDVSEATRQAIDKAVHDILQESLERGIAILAANRAILDRSAQALLRQETLDEAALKELTVGLRPLEA